MLRCHLRLSKFVEVKIPAQDAFDEEYMTDDDEECRLKVRDVCAMRAKNVGAMEVIVRALSLCGLHYWLICAGRYSDLFFLDFLYITYAWLVCTVASSVPEFVEVAMYIDYIVHRMHPIYIDREYIFIYVHIIWIILPIPHTHIYVYIYSLHVEIHTSYFFSYI